jgi:hypothetical protein
LVAHVSNARRGLFLSGFRAGTISSVGVLEERPMKVVRMSVLAVAFAVAGCSRGVRHAEEAHVVDGHGRG